MKVIDHIDTGTRMICPGCRRLIKQGEFTLVHEQKVGHLLHTFAAHVECVERKVETSPVGSVRREKFAFEQLKARIVATGKAFPDDQDHL